MFNGNAPHKGGEEEAIVCIADAGPALVGRICSKFSRPHELHRLATGLAILVGGELGARIWCELLMAQFKINEHTQKMAERP